MAISLSIPKQEKTKDRAQQAKETCWDVDSLYSNWNEWEEELKRVGKEGEKPHWPEIAAMRSSWHKSPETLKALIVLCLSLERKLEKLATYAHMRHDEDVASEIPKGAQARITALLYDFREETAWIEPAFFQLSEETMKRFLHDPTLKEYRFYLEKILRLKPHTLSAQEEELLAKSGLALETAHRAFGSFNDADIKFPSIQDSAGGTKELTHGKYLVYMRDKDRTLRKEAFLGLHRSFQGFENTLCDLLNGQIQAHLFTMKARKYPSCLNAALFPNQIDTTVYEALIQAVRKELAAVHKYIALRKKTLKLAELHAYDLYAPLTEEVDMGMEYEEAVRCIVDALSLLGKDYQKTLQEGLLQHRWVDRFENTRKRSGAYSGGCYDSKPFILMNYHGTFNDVMTLAHEAGHSMHTYMSRTHQPYQYAQYSIFVAEVASTFHEELVLRYFLNRAKKKEEQIFLINQELDDMRATLVRQTLFAEFELRLHRFAEEGVPLTPALLNKVYRELNQEYYGPDLVLDPELDIEWARIPHFYYNFYVYQYATGISAAHALVERVLEKGETAREEYLAFLSAGCSKYPLDALRDAGVDMRMIAPVESAMRHFRQLVEKLEKLL